MTTSRQYELRRQQDWFMRNFLSNSTGTSHGTILARPQSIGSLSLLLSQQRKQKQLPPPQHVILLLQLFLLLVVSTPALVVVQPVLGFSTLSLSSSTKSTRRPLLRPQPSSIVLENTSMFGPPNSQQQHHQQPNRHHHPLWALIYGWDEYDEDDDDENEKQKKKQQHPDLQQEQKPSSSYWTQPVTRMDTSTSTEGRTSFSFFTSRDACDVAGSVVAETLSNDRTYRNTLAKLAFAFRPPEHSGLKLQDIESVNVLCVTPNTLEVEVILCENLGCVSLHIPIQFPSSCQAADVDHPQPDKFQACVLQNLETLDVTASSTVTMHLQQQQQQQNDPTATTFSTPNIIDELYLSSSDKVQLPDWWVLPTAATATTSNMWSTSATTTTSALEQECQTLQDILNEDEFQTELCALAHDGLSRMEDGEGGGSNFLLLPTTIEKAKCVMIGPAGIGIKTVAKQQQNQQGTTVMTADLNSSSSISTMVMDVWYPFGGPPKDTPAALRAAVLGAVALAAEQQQQLL